MAAAGSGACRPRTGQRIFQSHLRRGPRYSAISGGVLPDLRYSQALADPKAWNSIIRDGLLENRGMVSVAPAYTPAQTEAIRAYVIHRANQDAAKQGSHIRA